MHNDEKTSFSGALGRFGILSEARFYTESRTHYQAQQGRDRRKGEERGTKGGSKSSLGNVGYEMI
jgi:hypothetical protein